MDNDPILKDKSVGLNDNKGISSPYTQGLYALNLSNDEVEKIGTFINEFYEKINRNITRNALTMFKGAVFAVGTRELDNPEWKEHCASSLREIFHAWDGGLSSGKFVFNKEDNTCLYRNRILSVKTGLEDAIITDLFSNKTLASYTENKNGEVLSGDKGRFNYIQNTHFGIE